jgi:hypothetical protein
MEKDILGDTEVSGEVPDVYYRGLHGILGVKLCDFELYQSSHFDTLLATL